MWRLVLLVAAAVCFLLAAFSVPIPRVNLIGLGLFFLTMGEFLLK
jgi:hypothetical protein